MGENVRRLDSQGNLIAGLLMLLSGACKSADSQGAESYASRPAVAKPAEFVDSVLEAVYRVEITEAVHHESPAPAFFLSGVGGGDAPDQVVGRLQDLGARVKKASASTRDRNHVVRDRNTEERGVLVTVTDYRWLDDGSLYVEARLEAGPGGMPDQDAAFVLRGDPGSWKVDPLWSGESAVAR
jgi:hypothetical protein